MEGGGHRAVPQRYRAGLKDAGQTAPHVLQVEHRKWRSLVHSTRETCLI